jgi:hypothetical protein
LQSAAIRGPSVRAETIARRVNLGKGWAGFDYEEAFGKPTKVVNDAVMQALGGYEGGRRARTRLRSARGRECRRTKRAAGEHPTGRNEHAFVGGFRLWVDETHERTQRGDRRRSASAP